MSLARRLAQRSAVDELYARTRMGSGGGGGIGTDAFRSVKLFGAKGDGTANDGPAVQSALTQLAGTGVSLWFPAGTYNIATAVTVPPDVTIWTAGAGGQIVLFTGGSAPAVANQALVYGVPPGSSAFNPAWYLLTAISIDVAAGSDQAAGTPAAPIKSWAEAVRRWGSVAPLLTVATTVTFHGVGHTDGSDPVIWRPVVANGVVVALLGSINPVASISLSGVVAKNRATPQLLNANLGASAAVTQLITNTTHSSRAWAYKVTAGTTFAISQPLTPAAVPESFPSEVDTWANTDSAQLSTLTNINLVAFEPTIAAGPAHICAYLGSCTVFDPSQSGGANGLNSCQLGQVIAQEVLFQRFVTATPVAWTRLLNNCFLNSGCSGGGIEPTLVWAGAMGDAGSFFGFQQMENFQFDADAIIGGGFTYVSLVGNETVDTCSALGLTYVDTGATLHASGGLSLVNSFFSTQGILWGPGGYDAIGRTLWKASVTAVSTFLQTGGLLLNGGANGHSVTVGSPDVLNGGISVTPAHLDAAAGVAGFGGNAFNLGGGAIVKSNSF